MKGLTSLSLLLEVGGKVSIRKLSERVLLGEAAWGAVSFEGKGESCSPDLPLARENKMRGKSRGQW